MTISKKRLKELEAIPDSEIDTSDIPELGDWFWKNAKVEYPEAKKTVSLQIDREVLDWFKKAGGGYQSRINAVLKAYMEDHRNL